MTMSGLLGYLGAFLGGATPWLEAVVVVPVAILAGLEPVTVTVLAVLGNLATVALAVLWGDRLNRWWTRRRRARVAASGRQPTHPDPEAGSLSDGKEAVGARRRGRAARLWRRYGLPGLAVLAPIVTGTQAAALVAVTTGAPRGATLWWIGAGTVAWAVTAAVATVAGVDLFAG